MPRITYLLINSTKANFGKIWLSTMDGPIFPIKHCGVAQTKILIILNLGKQRLALDPYQFIILSAKKLEEDKKIIMKEMAQKNNWTIVEDNVERKFNINDLGNIRLL